jgi:hypothetical protein
MSALVTLLPFFDKTAKGYRSQVPGEV